MRLYNEDGVEVFDGVCFCEDPDREGITEEHGEGCEVNGTMCHNCGGCTNEEVHFFEEAAIKASVAY